VSAPTGRHQLQSIAAASHQPSTSSFFNDNNNRRQPTTDGCRKPQPALFYYTTTAMQFTVATLLGLALGAQAFSPSAYSVKSVRCCVVLRCVVLFR
jgi:hypothetical protein